mmetsp:Transcript_13607/g.39247  ORF Transcript_13607/g.39247 Transcript_13607/m.39247 type:complete len:116 (-) Transcript_13607:548-895(-)
MSSAFASGDLLKALHPDELRIQSIRAELLQSDLETAFCSLLLLLQRVSWDATRHGELALWRFRGVALCCRSENGTGGLAKLKRAATLALDLNNNLALVRKQSYSKLHTVTCFGNK